VAEIFGRRTVDVGFLVKKMAPTKNAANLKK